MKVPLSLVYSTLRGNASVVAKPSTFQSSYSVITYSETFLTNTYLGIAAIVVFVMVKNEYIVPLHLIYIINKFREARDFIDTIIGLRLY